MYALYARVDARQIGLLHLLNKIRNNTVRLPLSSSKTVPTCVRDWVKKKKRFALSWLRLYKMLLRGEARFIHLRYAGGSIHTANNPFYVRTQRRTLARNGEFTIM